MITSQKSPSTRHSLKQKKISLIEVPGSLSRNPTRSICFRISLTDELDFKEGVVCSNMRPENVLKRICIKKI